MVKLRQFSALDAAIVQEKQMPDASMEEVLQTIQAWGTKTFQGKPFEMFALTADNGASIALHEKLGFQTDGYLYTNAKGRKVLLCL